jgi:hypothetical protein
LARALQAAPPLTCISQAEIFLLSHSEARQEDTTSLLLVAQRVPRNNNKTNSLVLRQSRQLDLRGPVPTDDAFLLLQWIANRPVGDTEYVNEEEELDDEPEPKDQRGSAPGAAGGTGLMQRGAGLDLALFLWSREVHDGAKVFDSWMSRHIQLVVDLV